MTEHSLGTLGWAALHVMRETSVHLLFSLLSLLFQIWRLITNFLFFGPLGFSFFFNMIFLYPLISVKFSAPILA